MDALHERGCRERFGNATACLNDGANKLTERISPRAIRDPAELHSGDGGVSITSRSITMRITSKGQVTIPIEVREKLGLLPNTEVAFEVRGNTARIIKVAGKRAGGRGANLLAGLRGRSDVRMTTDEILALTRKIK